MKDKSNVIQFPKPQQVPTPAPSRQPKAAEIKPADIKPVIQKKGRPGKSLWITVASLFAITLATGTTNLSIFSGSTGTVDLASEGGRGLASIPEERDAAWEKSVAESLASAEVRDLASISVGHEASLDEKVRYGVLERKYTILRDMQRNEVESIILQGAGTEPTLVSNRAEFLGQFGRWLSEKYGFSELKSSELVKDVRHEVFTVFDANHKAYAVADFELDNYQRLLKFHFKPL